MGRESARVRPSRPAGPCPAVILWLGLLACLPTAADDDSHHEAALAYLAATDTGGRMAAYLEDLKVRQLGALRKWYIPEGRRKAAAGFIDRAARLIDEELSWARLRPELASVYASVYTEEELRGLVRFYRTPLGTAYLRKRPRLLRMSLAIAEDRMRALVPRIDALRSEYADEAALDR